MSKRNRRSRTMKTINFWEKRKEQFERHPQSDDSQSGFKTTNCLRQIKKMFCPSKPEITKLVFSPLSWVKMNCYINLIGELEITGLGKIEDGVITDLKLIKQSVKPALVDCTAEHIVEFISEVGANEISKWSLDWHSHVNMGVNPSGTDTANWASMFEARDYKQFPVMIVNKRQAVYCHCYMGDGDSEAIEITKYPVEFTKEEIETIYNECKLEVEAKCTKEYTTSYVSGGYNPISYRNSYQEDNDIDYYGNNYQQKKLILPNDYSGKGLASKSTIEKNERQCQFCGAELITLNEINNGVCNECFTKYNCEKSIEKCPSCGAELTDDELVNGICDDCAEALTRPTK